MILKSLEQLQYSDSLLLIGYPLLTQVNVGIFYILINMFLKVFINLFDYFCNSMILYLI